MPDNTASDVMLGRAHDAPRFCDVTGWAVPVPAFRDERYMALARTLAQPVHPVTLDETAIMARLDAIEALCGHAVRLSVRSTGNGGYRVWAASAEYSDDGDMFFAADTITDALDALERKAAALRDGVA